MGNYRYKEVDLWYEPTKKMREDVNYVCEMTEYEHAFLSGLLREHKPKKILEVGVAEGGTTALILNVLNSFKYGYEMFSVDLCEKYYRDANKTTGFYVDELKIDRANHKFLLGESVADEIGIIGDKVDFVIIDTTHCMPGEVLDFLTIYPFLSENAVVILHDVNLNERLEYPLDLDVCEFIKAEICTKLLLAVVCGNKYMMNSSTLTNIAAFQITEETKNSIKDLFWLLTMNWQYMPPENMLNSYRNIFVSKYDYSLVKIFDISVVNNKRFIEHVDLLKYNDKFFPSDEIAYGSNVILYGAGCSGKKIKRICDKLPVCSIVCWVDKNYEKICDENIKSPEIIEKISADYILIAVESNHVYNDIYKCIVSNGWHRGKKIVGLRNRKQ